MNINPLLKLKLLSAIGIFVSQNVRPDYMPTLLPVDDGVIISFMETEFLREGYTYSVELFATWKDLSVNFPSAKSEEVNLDNLDRAFSHPASRSITNYLKSPEN